MLEFDRNCVLIRTLLVLGIASLGAAPALAQVVVADAGDNLNLECTSRAGAFATLDGLGSTVNGAIYRGDLDSGLGATFVEGAAGRFAAGTFYEERNDRLWVAGGFTGEVRAYNGSTGALLATYTFAGGGFLNDLVVLKDRVYVTDSQHNLVHLPNRRDHHKDTQADAS